MEYSNSNTLEKIDTNMNFAKLINLAELTNLDEIEEHYSNVFYKVDSESTIYVFKGSSFQKTDNCNLFIKYIIKVVEYYQNTDSITIILDLKDLIKNALNIDFIIKFVKKFKKIYENVLVLRKFYIINCHPSLKRIYLFIKPFLHPDTVKKISVIKEGKSFNIEYYYHN